MPADKREARHTPSRDKKISFVDTKMGGPYGQLDGEDLKQVKTEKEISSTKPNRIK